MLNSKKTMDGKPRAHRNMMCSRNGKHVICHKARLENWAKAWLGCFENSVNLRFSKKQWLPLKNVKQKHDMIRDAFWEDMIQEMWWATLKFEKQMRILLQESRWEMVVAWVSHSYGEKLTDLKIRKRLTTQDMEIEWLWGMKRRKIKNNTGVYSWELSKGFAIGWGRKHKENCREKWVYLFCCVLNFRSWTE